MLMLLSFASLQTFLARTHVYVCVCCSLSIALDFRCWFYTARENFTCVVLMDQFVVCMYLYCNVHYVRECFKLNVECC